MQPATSAEPRLAAVREALARVVDPCSIATGVPITLPEMGLVKDVVIRGDHVEVTLQLTSPICWQAMNIVAAVERVVGEVEGVGSVACTVDPEAQWMPTMIAPAAQARLRRLRPLPVR
jgi:metal-sulfur cluster biosynthetic enzyme